MIAQQRPPTFQRGREEDRNPRFLVDLNVGRLAKWLRAIGYDAAFRPEADDGELVRLAMREGRVLLTKDTRLVLRRVITSGRLPALLVRGDDVREQLRYVMSRTGIALDEKRLFSRCIECNATLAERPKAAVAGRVPPYVLLTQEQFMECPSCCKLYWRGTHWGNMRLELSRVAEAG